MATSDLNVISSSKNEIYNKLLNIAASGEYVTSSSNFANVDFLRSGEFGYVTESLAMFIRDSAFQKTMLYNENFLNTAIMPKSIYNWAKTFNVNCLDATPSCRMAALTISTSDIDKGIDNSQSNISDYQKKYGIKESNNFIVIDKTNNLIAGETYFSLEHSVEIYRTGSTYVAKYCIDEEDSTTNFGDYSNPIIETQYYRSGSVTYLVLNVRVYQYKTVTSSKTITSSSFLDTKIHNFSYSGQLCGLSMTYTKGSSTEIVNLKFSNIGTDDEETSSTKTAYYSITDTGTIEVKFASNSVSGLPQAGGILTMKMFETDGSNGNISFSGTAIFMLSQEDYKSIAITAELGSVILTNGVDQSSLSEIKTIIINKLSTRNTIVTENDLNLWFETQSALLSDLSNSKVTFRKEKDNILKRTFSSYLLLRDGVSISAYTADSSTKAAAAKANASYISCPIPTNTIDSYYIFGDTSTSNGNGDYVITPKTKFNFDYTTSRYVHGVGVDQDTSDYSFVSPFYIKAKIRSGYTKAAYFFLEPDDSSALKLSSVSELTNMDFIPTTLEVSHTDSSDSEDSKISGTYNFKFTVTSSQDLSGMTISSGSITIDSSVYSLDASNLKFISESDSSDSSEKNYSITVTATLNDIVTTLPKPCLSVKFGSSASYSYVPESPVVYLSLKGTSGSNDSAAFNVTMVTTETIHIFSSLDEVMSSDISILTSSDSTITGFVIRGLPVVASYWMSDTINKEWFRKQLFVYIQMLKENTDKLETNTFFNIKFRNTYGISNTFKSITTNLRLKLTIYLNKDAVSSYNGSSVSSTYSGTDTTVALETEIRDYIRVLVDKSNSDGALKISKIIMITQGAYSNYIDHIEFNGLNNTFNQYIGQISMSDDESSKYPLEYINLDNTTTTTSDGKTTSNLEKDITFVEI